MTCSPAYAVTRAALDNARHGQGPTLLEAYTYRMGAHTTSDDPTRYRIAERGRGVAGQGPDPRLRAFLETQQLADEDFFAERRGREPGVARRLREAVRAMPDPDPLQPSSTTCTRTVTRS